jgi:hypothetical protein
VKTTTGAIDEASELIDLIERHERFAALKAKVAVADSRYGNTANLLWGSISNALFAKTCRKTSLALVARTSMSLSCGLPVLPRSN